MVVISLGANLHIIIFIVSDGGIRMSVTVACRVYDCVHRTKDQIPGEPYWVCTLAIVTNNAGGFCEKYSSFLGKKERPQNPPCPDCGGKIDLIGGDCLLHWKCRSKKCGYTLEIDVVEE